MLAFLGLKGHPPRDIFVTENYQPIVSRLFGSLNVPVRLVNDKSISRHGADEQAHIEVAVNDALSFAEMIIHAYGDNVRDEIRLKQKELCLKQITSIHLVLNLEAPTTMETIVLAESLGFFFGGILPYGIDGHHALVLQYSNNAMIDFDKLKLLSPKSPTSMNS